MNWYIIAQKLKDVELVGKLRQAKNGFTYLDIPDNVISGLYALIDEDGVEKPPYDLKKYNSIGAHVSVIHEEDVKENDLEIEEIGQEFSFELGEFKSANPEGWDEVKRVYFVQIHSEELEKLRQSYGLSKKMNGHEFHITIGIEKGDKKK